MVASNNESTESSSMNTNICGNIGPSPTTCYSGNSLIGLYLAGEQHASSATPSPFLFQSLDFDFGVQRPGEVSMVDASASTSISRSSSREKLLSIINDAMDIVDECTYLPSEELLMSNDMIMLPLSSSRQHPYSIHHHPHTNPCRPPQ